MNDEKFKVIPFLGAVVDMLWDDIEEAVLVEEEDDIPTEEIIIPFNPTRTDGYVAVTDDDDPPPKVA